jgi:uncharacterized protein YecT (DUF1311 family)
MTYPLPLRTPLFLLALTMPMSGLAGNNSPYLAAAASPGQKPQHSPAETVPEDCDGIPSLDDKRDCERTHPMRCKPYREMHVAERELAEFEQPSIASARKAYASYADGDAAYLTDLEAAARKANHAWRAYREAQCTLEPFAQGMSRDLSEHLAEACRVRMTRARIDEIKGFHTDADPSRPAGNGH